MTDPADRRVPLDGIVFGYGPMLPLAAAALGAWLLPAPWPAIATHLAIVWGALILVFVAGVRRGFGFGDPAASTAVEIVTMLVYFTLGGLALVVPGTVPPVVLLVAGFVLVPLLDRRAARHDDAPAYFARLRPPQMGIAVASLVALLVNVSSLPAVS